MSIEEISPQKDTINKHTLFTLCFSFWDELKPFRTWVNEIQTEILGVKVSHVYKWIMENGHGKYFITAPHRTYLQYSKLSKSN